MSSAGAKRGYSRETIFVNLIINDPNFRMRLNQALFDLNIFSGVILTAEDVKKSCKSDVKLICRDSKGSIVEIGCSLKAAEANFNQIDRRWLSNWKELLGMPDSIEFMLQSSLNRKIINSRDKFILDSEASSIVPFLESKKNIIFKHLFTRTDENLKLFIVYNEKNNVWSVSSISEIIKFLFTEPFSISNQGVLYIGNCLSLQRKGGDGNIKIPPKTSELHPSNQLQFKIKPLSVIKEVKTINL